MEMSRRGFLEGAGVVSAAMLAVGAGALSASGSESGSASSASGAKDAIAWEAEADAVIIGSGASGCSAAITMMDESLGDCLILEAAPEEYAGGNSRVSGCSVFCADTADAAFNYQKALNCGYYVEDELLHAWAEGIAVNIDWLDDVCGGDMQLMGEAEFTDVIDADKCHYYANEGKVGNQGLWRLLKAKADELGVEFYFDTRAQKLIIDDSGTIIGVTTEDGRNFRARKGVLLCCGGFEYNSEIMNTYAPSGFSGTQGRGTMYNRGDGFIMANSMGAKMWHMNSFAGSSFGVQVVDKDDTSLNAIFQIPKDAGAHDYIFVGPEGGRFMYEERQALTRHGKLFNGGVWSDMALPAGSYCIFGQNVYAAGKLAGASSFALRTDTVTACQSIDDMIAAGIVVKSDTVEDLATATGLDVDVLQNTLDVYAECVANNFDPAFGKGQALSDTGNATVGTANADLATQVAAFDLQPIEPPYYSVKLVCTLLNTQGGPKRTVNSEVTDVDGNPIPRLYACGELGTLYAYKYNLGGNLADAIASGRTAARHCASLEGVK